ncbi:hypothetical protein RclHR1_08230003 [Rhizophagus clarus]|uniref:Uncharacterized protein n=1 Tax=Rhizophagus clarus TaxID=94130 RepID=A0A2Z6SFD7_9GLOM|nr:hypothetical protein RclHR1_08230003 [Rhizophagus clarus]GES95537.1 hypothetical protein GLOIN_2v1559494 [Rhizophagus clarus]
MGDLHQKLSELRTCFDDGLINETEYETARNCVLEFWATSPPQPEKSFWQKLYDKAVYLKDKFMENIVRPILDRLNRLLIGN